jgi:hypothetical protein
LGLPYSGAQSGLFRENNMTDKTTIDEIYAAINPIPGMLAAKGKVKPAVEFKVEANVSIGIVFRYMKAYAANKWDSEYHHFYGDNFATALEKAIAFVNDLPSAEDANLHNFMGKLGSLIDFARDDGIKVDYLNPLLETMKRLSENVITHQPKRGED